MIASLTFAAIWPSFPIRRSVVRRAGRLLIPAALSIVSLLNSPPARAESQNALAVPIAAKPNAMRSGALLVKDDDGRYAEAPRLGTDVHVVVSGPTARAHVTQMFQNPSERWIEAVYVYPLPDGGSVDTLKMIVGDRIVVGEIKGRPEAREAYENAKAAGQKAALIEQERPNIFTSSVANIGPGETVVVQIEYQEPVHQSGAEFSLRVPLVVAPRYSPAPVVQAAAFNAGRNGSGGVSDPVPDRDRIAPPVLDPRDMPLVNPVSISVRLQPGFAIGGINSHHHQIKIDQDGDARLIQLAEGPVPADRDFELTWGPQAAATPSVGLFHERVADSDYLLAFVTPPLLTDTASKLAREIVFVIDNSGSMGGTSIVQAKASLSYALSRLGPSDRFNIIRFDDTMDMLFADTVPADSAHIAKAKAFVAAIEARGGTEMVPPMQAALTDPREEDAAHVRQVVFLTDGEIGNEQQLFETIGRMRGRSRVFMVGIGSAPNTFLMTRAAELGRGTFTHIGSVDQVEERMRGLFEKLGSPVVTNLTATFSGAQADVTPAVLPDLYRGEPVVLAAKLSALSGTLEVSGLVGDRPWTISLPVDKAAEGEGLSKLWARRKIDDAEAARTLREITSEDADKRILGLALDHHLVTRLTSLVAVDRTPRRPDGAHLSRAELPLNLPAGWDFDKVFGKRRMVPDQPGERHADTGPAARGTAAQTFAPASPDRAAVVIPIAQTNVTLPKTATDADLRMLMGLLLCATSFVLLAVRRWSQAFGF